YSTSINGLFQCRTDAAEDRLHAVQIVRERLLSAIGQGILRLRQAVRKCLRARDIAGLFQLARMETQAPAVNEKQTFELCEAKRPLSGKSGHNSQPPGLVDQRVQPTRRR